MGRRKSAISLFSLSSQVHQSKCQSKCCFGGTRKISGFNEYPTGFFKKSPKEPKSTLLTGQQRLSIIRTWRKIASDIGPLGISAMNKMLELDCDAKMLFDFSHKNDQDMQHDRRFRQHAFWLIQAVNAVLENLDRLDETVAYMFKQIGEKHAGIPKFHISYFGLLPDVWDYVWEEHLKERYSQHMQTSWDRIFQYIVDRLAEGYYLRAPYEPTAGPSSDSTFPSSSAYSVSVSGRTISPTSTSTMVSFISTQKKDSTASLKSKKGSKSKSAGMSFGVAPLSQMSSVQTFDLDQDIGSTDMVNVELLQKEGGENVEELDEGDQERLSALPERGMNPCLAMPETVTVTLTQTPAAGKTGWNTVTVTLTQTPAAGKTGWNTVTVTLTQNPDADGHHMSRMETHLSDGTTQVSTTLTPETAQLLSKLHPAIFPADSLMQLGSSPSSDDLAGTASDLDSGVDAHASADSSDSAAAIVMATGEGLGDASSEVLHVVSPDQLLQVSTGEEQAVPVQMAVAVAGEDSVMVSAGMDDDAEKAGESVLVSDTDMFTISMTDDNPSAPVPETFDAQ
ncbi:uncharacterized protein [Littorina saxatilis]|uniref:Globin n=1 Tax=Littorina saxatilis TaxID=31220 RepID=A0AAN9BP20_9CAEN